MQALGPNRGQNMINGLKATLSDCYAGLTTTVDPIGTCLRQVSGIDNIIQGLTLIYHGCVYLGAYIATGGAIQLTLTIAPFGIARAAGLGEAAGEVTGAVTRTVRAPTVIRVGELKLPGVPRGATGTPVATGKGLEYPLPRGTSELDPRVTRIRIMDPTTGGPHPYPNGYAVYMNDAGQSVNPTTGQTVSRASPLAHIPLP